MSSEPNKSRCVSKLHAVRVLTFALTTWGISALAGYTALMPKAAPRILGFVPWPVLIVPLLGLAAFVPLYGLSFVWRLCLGGCALYVRGGQLTFVNRLIFEERMERIEDFGITPGKNVYVHLKSGRTRIIPNISLLEDRADVVSRRLGDILREAL